jgi:PKD repeat protein
MKILILMQNLFTTKSSFTEHPGKGRRFLISAFQFILVTGALLISVQQTSATQLSGIYTINPAGAATATNFKDFSSAITYMTSTSARSDGGTANTGTVGVSGAVSFLVSAGTYTGRVDIPNITGASATNTVTFDGGAGNAATRILTYAAPSNIDAYTLRFNNTNFVTVRNLTIRNTGTSAGLGVSIYGTTTNCTLARCIVLVDSNSTSTSFKAIQMTNSTDVNDGTRCGGTSAGVFGIVIDSNEISGGRFSFYGCSSYNNSAVAHSLFMRYNWVRQGYECGIGVSNVRGYQVNYNLIETRLSNTAGFGFSQCNGGTTSGSVQNYEIIGNTFGSNGQYGIYTSSANNSGPNAKIWNNFFKGDWRNTSARAMNLNNFAKIDIWANTIILQNDLNNTGCGIYLQSGNGNSTLKNNNIVLTGAASQGLAVIAESGTLIGSDYNNYYKVNTANQPLVTMNGVTLDKSNFRNAAGFDVNSLNDNPKLASATDPRPFTHCLIGTYISAIPLDVNFVTRNNPPTIGAAESAGGFALDAEMTAFISPVFPVGSGNNDVEVKIVNKGGTAITSLDISVNLGTVTRTINWSGTLNSCASTTVLFTGTNQVNIGPGNNQIKAWVSSPNGGTDLDKNNDTISNNFCIALSGNYSINAAGSGASNFPNFTAAVNALKSCGISGAVTFNVAAGIYNEHFIITPINGSSAANTVTFDGGAGNAATRTITFGATVNGDMHTIEIQGGSNLRFTNLSIMATGVNYGWPVHIMNNSVNVHFKHNIIQTNDLTSSNGLTAIIPVVFSNSTSSYSVGVNNVNNIEIDSNTLNGGYTTVWVYGNSQVDVYNIRIRNNVVTNAYYAGIYNYNMANSQIKNNKITLRSANVNSYGIYLTSVSSAVYPTEVSGNEVTNYASQYGVYLSSANNPGSRGKLHNNMFSGFRNVNSYGIYMTSSSNWDVWHNSVNIDYPTTSTTSACIYATASAGTDIRNNILAVTAQGATAIPAYLNTSAQITGMDYNNYFKAAADNFTTLINVVTPATLISKSNLKGNLGFNSNSVVEFPLFSTASNLRLNNLGLSPIGDTGPALPVDIDNKPRCMKFPTVGASESPFVVSSAAGIVVDDTVFVNSPVLIYNLSATGEPKTHLWTIDSAGSFSSVHVTNTFNSTGTYTIKLITTSCFGTDSAVKTITVVNPVLPPLSAFVSDVNSVDQGDVVNLRDLSTGGPSSWSWAANPSAGVQFLPNANVQHPQVIFNIVGTYEICLTASNSVGAGNKVCRSSYIDVIEATNICGTKTVSKTASGKLFDSGGKSVDYGNNQLCGFLIDPCASSVTLSFSAFNLAPGDLLKVFDGKDENGTPLHTGSGFSGNIIPSDVTASTGKIFVQIKTDPTGVLSGFEASWTSVAKSFNKPAAAFLVPDTLYTGAAFTFTNNSTGIEPELQWDFNNDGNIDATVPTPTYTYNTAGIYIARLSIKDCGGTDGAAKSIRVIDPTAAPVPNFISNYSIISPEQKVNFYDRSTQAPTKWSWTVSPSTITYMDGTDSTSQNPQIKFNEVGNYNITLVAINSFGQGSTTKTSFIRVVDYCFPGAGLNTDLGITRVTFAGIDNVSLIGPSTYTNYTQSVQSAAVQKGAKYPIIVERGTNNENMTRKVWIDYNGDGIFSASELVASHTKDKVKVWIDTITIPLTVNTGSTRMRIATSYGISTNTACGPNSYGEFEDYTVTIYNNLVRPVITLIGPANVTMEVGTAYTDAGATAFDDLEGSITHKIIPGNNLPPNQGIPGTYYYRYNVSDLEGNSAEEKVRTIIITPDTTRPVITLLGANPLIVPTGTLFADPGATAFDSFDGVITNKIVVTGGPVNSNVVGQYILTYTVTDNAGNVAVETRTVDVGDAIIPVIILKGADTVYVDLGSTFNDPGAVVTDNLDQGLTYSVDLSGINNQVVGQYLLTYTAEDLSGNKAVPQTRLVIVRDVTPPVLTLFDDVVEIEVYSSYTEPVPAYNVSDNYYTNVQVNRTGNVDTSKVDTYFLMYIAVDGSGNKSEPVIRTVKVVDTQKPVITLKGDKYMTVCRWSEFNDSGVSVYDNYDLSPALTVKGSVDMLNNGLYSIVYQATDQSGNKSKEVERTVRVLTCAANGIDDHTGKLEVSLYPNPTTGSVNLALNRTDLRNFEIVVKDVLGRTVNASVLKDQFAGNATIDLGNETAGMYFITVTVNNEILTSKIKVIK